MAGDDDFDLSKYVLRLSKKIAQLTKDYVGLPFSTSTQLPFSIDSRPQARSKFYSTTKKWQRGDPLIGFYTPQTGQRKMILNLPDGTTMLDLCYPGWEVAVLDPPGLEHFFAKRYLFGDYYGHLLNGRPLQQNKSSKVAANSVDEKDAIDIAMARQAEIFRKRRTSIQQAAEQQQERGVPFDVQPQKQEEFMNEATSGISGQSAKSLDSALSNRHRTLQQVTIATHSVRDATTGVSGNRLVIQKKYDNGEVETVERRSQNKIKGELDCDVEQLLASQLFNVFIASPGKQDSSQNSASKDVEVEKDSSND